MLSARLSIHILACFLIVAGCSKARQLMPTPTIYTGEDAPLFEELPNEYTSTLAELIYVTDRAPETDENGNLSFGYKRSDSLSIGTTVVNLGQNTTWADLVEASRAESRVDDFELSLISIDEFTRLPPTPTPYGVTNGKITEDPIAVSEMDRSISLLQSEVKRRMALTTRKDAYIYVHGYHNTFEDSAFALAELWHFFGREGLPILYTWPAGHPGVFGYTYDRESSEFTVFHLKQLISWLAEQQEIENIHVIAHSRGTDVAISAFRELVIWARGAGVDPRKHFKIKNFVLAAPDYDVQVLSQRVSAERLALAVDQATLYTSPDDKAIGLAEILFASPRGRLGTASIDQLTDQEIERMKANSSRLNVINFDGESNSFGHSYFRNNPAVSSDLVLNIRYGLKPGDPRRPLENIGLNFWRVPEGYPN